MKHAQKLKLARKLLTVWEIKRHVSPFMSKAWHYRRIAKAKKQLSPKAN